jgi:5-methylthioadenosine/S-adenosylhomocysteine deaminase
MGPNLGGVLFVGGAVVTVDDDENVFDPGWLHVVDGHIAAVGAGDPPEGLVESAERRVDCSGSAVMPGMVNAHTHLFQTFFRGQADDKPLLDWLRECIWPAAIHLDRSSAYLAALLGLVENLRTGATSVIDHQYIHVDEQIDDGVCEAAEASGARFVLARGWADRNYEPKLMETLETVMARTSAVRDRWHGRGSGRIGVELAPLIPWGCSDEAMIATDAVSREWGSGTHLHCAETAVEVEMSIEERGLRHVEWLDRLGVLGPQVQLAHSVWLDDGELDLVAERGATVVHCPVSNMYLASGVARVVEMRERGINVALASDGPGSNNRQDMFEVMKATVLLQKIHRLDAVALQPAEVLHMACRGGATAMGASEEIGALTPGRRADIVVVDLGSVFVAPVHRVPSALVYCASPADVNHVMVDGAFVLEDGRVTVVDEEALIEEATAAAASVFRKAGIETRLTSR